MQKPQQYLRNSEIITSEIDNETVMMDISFESYFGLKAIGTEIWRLLETPHSVEQVAEKLTQVYDVSMEQCVNDVNSLFEELLVNEMIIPVT